MPLFAERFIHAVDRRRWRGSFVGLVLLAPGMGLVPGVGLAPAAAQPAVEPGSCLSLIESLSERGRVALDGVEFDFNRASLRPDSLPALIAARDAILAAGGAWTIEGHTDNRGSHAYNQRLSEARAQAVRDWLVAAGVPAANLVVAGFSFDRPVADNASDEGRARNRRVELVGTIAPGALGFGGPADVDPCPATLATAAHANAAGANAAGANAAGTGDGGAVSGAPAPAPVLPQWSGQGGEAWVPFAYLMATSYGAESGWSGERREMAPNTQPQACQALCLADERCGAFSFEPGGSFFVEAARCQLWGYGTEALVNRDNTYFGPDVYFAFGLKPDAAILEADAQVTIDAVLRDMAELECLRAATRLEAPESFASGGGLPLRLTTPADPVEAEYNAYIEIAELGEYTLYDGSKSWAYLRDMAQEGGAFVGTVWVPEPGDYVLRYVVDHPTAARHTIAEQWLTVTSAGEDDGHAAMPSNAAPGALGAVAAGAAVDALPDNAVNAAGSGSGVAAGSFEVGIDRPGEDLASTPISGDARACEALCVASDGCRAWTWVQPGVQGDSAVCWTKSGVPDAIDNDCCTSGVLGASAAPAAATPADAHAGGGASPAASDSEVVHHCDGLNPEACVVRRPDHDLYVVLPEGYGLTEPWRYVTAAGVRVERSSFELVRLADGVVIASVNPVRGGGACLPSVAGDSICAHEVSPTAADSYAMVAIAQSLTTVAMADATAAMGEDDGSAVEAGPMQGVWFVSVNTPGQSDDGRHLAVLHLMQDAGDVAVGGTFQTAPTVGPMPGIAGNAVGVLAGGTLNLTLSPDGQTGLVFTGREWGGQAYAGQLYATGGLATVTPVIVRLHAGPGEDWAGEPWMHGQEDGMAAALRMGAAALGDVLGSMDGDDRAMAELLQGLLGAMGAGLPGAAGAGAAAPGVAPALAPAFANGADPMQSLGGVEIPGLSVEEALELLAPHLGAQP